MQPLFYRYFIPFSIPAADDIASNAVDQVDTTRQLLQAGIISKAAAHTMLSSVLNSSEHIRDALVTVGLHDLVRGITTNGKLVYSKLTDANIVSLWKNDIDERCLASNFSDPPVATIPVYAEATSPKGFDVARDAIDVVKTLLREGHKFVGEIYGIMEREFDPFDTRKLLNIQLVSFNATPMTLRFEDEGDAIVVTSFKDDLDREMATTAAAARSNLGLGSSQTRSGQKAFSSSNTARQRLGQNLLKPSLLGVSSRGMAPKKTP